MSKRLVIWAAIYTDCDGSISEGPYISFTRRGALEDFACGDGWTGRVVKFIEAPKRRKKKPKPEIVYGPGRTFWLNKRRTQAKALAMKHNPSCDRK